MDKFDKSVVRHMRSMIMTRQNGKTKSVPIRDALLAKQAELAFKGSPYAMRHILALDQRATERQAMERQTKREALARVKHLQERRVASALASGKDIDQILPHPDDILIDTDDPRIIGPCDIAELAACRKVAKLRDLLYLQQGLEDRLRNTANGKPQDVAMPTSPLFLACFANQSLPKRFQLSPADEVEALLRASTMFTKRQLLLLCHRGWAELGIPLQRGAQLPCFGMCLSYFDITLATLARIRSAEGSRPEIEDALEEGRQRIFEELPLGDAAPVPQWILGERVGRA